MTIVNLLASRAGLVGAALGSLAAGALLVPAAIATTVAQYQRPTQSIAIPATGASVQLSQIRVASIPPAPQNPCPAIYYEAPYNQYVVVPPVCSPNLITQQLDQMGMLSTLRTQGTGNMIETTGGVAVPYGTNSAY